MERRYHLLSGYFLLLPLRDEAGVSLGTDNLPRLFATSLVLTLIATPLATFFLSRHHIRERGVQQLYRFLSATVLAFFLLYMAAASASAAPGSLLATSATATAAAAEAASVAERDAAASLLDRHHLHLLQSGAAAAFSEKEAGKGSATRGPPGVEAAATGAPGKAALSPAGKAVRAAFFLWVSLLNMVALSMMWAKAADVFPPEAATRLFGLLGAGATLGQLVGSLAAVALARAPLLRPGGAHSPSLLPLLLSAGLLEVAGQCVLRFRPPGGAVLPGSRSASPSRAPHFPRGSVAVKANPGPHVGGQQQQPGGGSGAGDGDDHQLGMARTTSSTRVGSDSKGRARTQRGQQGGQLAERVLEGYRMIIASPYLQHLCAYLILNYIASSFFYFEKSLAVATVANAASRTAWFATINSASAFFILALQLLATGRVLKWVGLPLALAATPTVAALCMAGVALRPLPAAVGLAEVVRKILAYSLARPAREVLFTVVSREEKYKAKITVDTVIQRVGDALAAGAFQTLVPALGFGPAGVGAACVPVCLLWAGVAYRLGLRQQALAAAAADKSALSA
eukprot:scaffold5.g869.t1